MNTKQREKKRRQHADAAKKRDAPGSIETSSSGITVSSQMISPPTFAPPPGEKNAKTPEITFPETPSSAGRRLIVKFPFKSKRKLSSKSHATPNKNIDGMDMSGLSSIEWMDISTESEDASDSSFALPSPMVCSTPITTRNPFKDITNSNVGSRQQMQGQQIRKQNNKEKSSENSDLKAALANAKNDSAQKDIIISKLLDDVRKLKEDNTDIQNKLSTVDDWIKPTYNKMSPAARTEFKTAVFMSKDELPTGTLSRLREHTQINFSNSPKAVKNIDNDLKISISSFAHENSSEVPDVKAAKKSIRYFYNYKCVLWMQYQSSHGSDLSYSTFCKYWPPNIVKPRVEDYGTCRCQVCENVELFVSGFKRSGFLPKEHVVDLIIQDARNENSELEYRFKEDLANIQVGEFKDQSVSFLQWEKVNIHGKNGLTRDVVQRIQKTLTTKEAATKLEAMYDGLKDHLERNNIIKKVMRSYREAIMESDDMAYIHIDWAENIEIQVPGEIQSAYFSHQSISLHTGYLYSKNNSGGFVSLRDSNNHKAEAFHAALKTTIEKVVAAGIKKIIMVSDSPTSQYRNNKNVYLTKQMALKYNISITWIYTEAGHGKSSCDGVGGNIKTLIKDLTVFNTSMVISTANDIKNLIFDKTTIDVTCHSQVDIDEVTNHLPSLSSLKGANKMHQINFTPDGVIKAKHLPTDPVSNIVNLKVLRKRPSAEDTENAHETG